MRTGLGTNLRRSAYARQLAQGQLNNTTWVLRNPAPTVELLLVWALSINIANDAGDALTFSQQRTTAAFLATATTFPIVPTDAPPPGLVGYFNSLTAFTPSWVWYAAAGQPFWPSTFPFTVLPPGWSLCVQDSTVATAAIDVAVWWEAMAPEEFEHQYGDTGLAVKRPAGAV